MRGALVASLVLVIALLGGRAHGATLVEQLTSTDRAEVERAVASIEVMPLTTPQWAATMIAAARACEDRLADPGRAAGIYERVVADAPDAAEAVTAQQRLASLRGHLGDGSEFAKQAAELSTLLAEADALTEADVVERAERLAHADWPGAGEAALWLAEWQRRHGRLEAALVLYDNVAQRFPGTEIGHTAAQGAAATALDAGDWDAGLARARQLPDTDDGDRILREELIARGQRGMARAAWLTRCWLAVLLVGLALAGSLLEAAARGGWRAPVLRPGTELYFLVPVAAVLVGAALTTNALIAPAVVRVSLGGIALAWLSGAGLDTLRARGRAIGARAAAHAVLCVAGVAALLYIALMTDQLLDLVVETMKFGPGQ